MEVSSRSTWVQFFGRCTTKRKIVRFLIAAICCSVLLMLLEVREGGSEPFNKGSVMNAGFLISSSMEQFDCFIFHDADLLPEDDRNMYTCASHPKHVAVEVDVLNYTYQIYQLAGGVLLFKPEQFLRVNGYSNRFWGWGGEDEDMGKRIIASGQYIQRQNFRLCRYSSVPHQRWPQVGEQMSLRLLQSSAQRCLLDGLGQLQMTVDSVQLHQLFTHIVLSDVGKPPENLLDLIPEVSHVESRMVYNK